MSKYLPDTALTCLSVGKEVFTYAQTDEGVLVECKGQLKVVGGYYDIYSYRFQNHVCARYEDEEISDGGPKLFTPLAAAHISSTRYLFYLDDNNQLQSVKSGDTPWPRDLGITKLNIRVACYSQLTAITIAKNGFEGICVYYQTKGRDAAIEMCGYSTKNRCWVKGPPDLTPNPPPPAPPPRVIDPPLFGTSMTAVPARDGLRVLSGNDLPVVYLQWDDLALAHSQDSQVQQIQNLGLRFAPHTSLTAVDDGDRLYLYYTSSQNNHIKVISIKDGKASAPETISTPTPRSSIAAVMPQTDRIVLFYQTLNADVGKVELHGVTFPKISGANAGAQVFPTTHKHETKLA